MQHPNTNHLRRQSPEVTMRLTHSTSDQNVYISYVCLISDIKPTDSSYSKEDGTSKGLLSIGVDEAQMEAEPIQVERSKALHELVEKPHMSKKYLDHQSTTDINPPDPYSTVSGEETDISDNDGGYENPKLLKLTKMKWLSESPNSTYSLSPTESTTSSVYSREAETDGEDSIVEKRLSTILKLDKEHNLFGLSNYAIVGSRHSKRMRKEDDSKPAFPQTAIVQVCCADKCCRSRSKSDFPPSLKCGSCKTCCSAPSCRSCVPQRTLFKDPPRCARCCSPPPPPLCCRGPPSCITSKTCFKLSCGTPVICLDAPCAPCDVGGMRVRVNRKPKYTPEPVLLTPRASCILSTPMMVRKCTHLPPCAPSSCSPSPCPCSWPARPSAPCPTPDQCFHNPPCLPPRGPRPCDGPKNKCIGKCKANKEKGCTNALCLGKSEEFKKAFMQAYGADQPPKPNTNQPPYPGQPPTKPKTVVKIDTTVDVLTFQSTVTGRKESLYRFGKYVKGRLLGTDKKKNSEMTKTFERETTTDGEKIIVASSTISIPAAEELQPVHQETNTTPRISVISLKIKPKSKKPTTIAKEVYTDDELTKPKADTVTAARVVLSASTQVREVANCGAQTINIRNVWIQAKPKVDVEVAYYIPPNFRYENNNDLQLAQRPYFRDKIIESSIHPQDHHFATHYTDRCVRDCTNQTAINTEDPPFGQKETAIITINRNAVDPELNLEAKTSDDETSFASFSNSSSSESSVESVVSQGDDVSQCLNKTKSVQNFKDAINYFDLYPNDDYITDESTKLPVNVSAGIQCQLSPQLHESNNYLSSDYRSLHSEICDACEECGNSNFHLGSARDSDESHKCKVYDNAKTQTEHQSVNEPNQPSLRSDYHHSKDSKPADDNASDESDDDLSYEDIGVQTNPYPISNYEYVPVAGYPYPEKEKKNITDTQLSYPQDPTKLVPKKVPVKKDTAKSIATAPCPQPRKNRNAKSRRKKRDPLVKVNVKVDDSGMKVKTAPSVSIEIHKHRKEKRKQNF